MSFDKAVLFSMFRPKVVPITVEHDGNTLECFVRELSAEQVFRLQETQKKPGADNEQFTINMLSQALCDEEGKSILTRDDAKSLKAMQVSAFNKLAQAVANSIGLTPADKAEAEKTAAGEEDGNKTDLEKAEPVGNA